MTDETLYFIRREDGRELGPFAAVFLPKFVETGTLKRTDELRRVGDEAWQAAGSLQGLFGPER